MRTKFKVPVITKEWLQQHRACEEGTEWFLNQKSKSLKVIIHKLIKASYFSWANWTLVRFMSHQQKGYHNFEILYPSKNEQFLSKHDPVIVGYKKNNGWQSYEIFSWDDGKIYE